jgi:signal transduction histidine kinase
MAANEIPSGRDEAGEITRKQRLVEGVPLLSRALDAVPSMVVILNANRQVVAANEVLLKLLDVTIAEVVSKRPGELFNCMRPPEGPDGCGTALHCVTCGALGAILESQQSDRQVVRECRILTQTPEGIFPLDLRVTVTPLAIAEERFLIAAIEDVSHSKRLAVLQRAFFHDVLNLAGCIRSYAQYINELNADKNIRSTEDELYKILARMADDLLEAIRAQQDLVAAESGDLVIAPESLPVSGILEDLRGQYARHPAAVGRVIAIADCWDGTVLTDRQILLRLLGNMVKNALEATAEGNTVTLSCRQESDKVIFAVHNSEVMPEDVQMQVFQRSFSTKSQSGRGIGTYSMKLFGERYLGGKVDFVSRAPEGTTFRLSLPINVSSEPSAH